MDTYDYVNKISRDVSGDDYQPERWAHDAIEPLEQVLIHLEKQATLQEYREAEIQLILKTIKLMKIYANGKI